MSPAGYASGGVGWGGVGQLKTGTLVRANTSTRGPSGHMIGNLLCILFRSLMLHYCFIFESFIMAICF